MRKRQTHFQLCLAAGLLVLLEGPAYAQPISVFDLSIEQLSQVRIISASRTPQPVEETPASIYVITADDIRRSGAATLPEALRLAPNLNVARRDAFQYAISARGFNNAVGNKLLVLIDGRTVYTPLFSGVFWEQQEVMLSDVDRIEVLSGPGAALWGANAVNGVINVITRSSGETQGWTASLRSGNELRGAQSRYGGSVGEDGHYRIHGIASQVGDSRLRDGTSARDRWSKLQVGARMDVTFAEGELTVQGDAYTGETQDRGVIAGFTLGRLNVDGFNLLGRWTRRFDNGSELQVSSYFDHAEREDAIFFKPDADIFDVELQHTAPLGRHQLIWGGGYRKSSDHIGPSIFTVFIPASRELHWANLFIQDRFEVTPRVAATLGLKLERNDYTGVESLPTARLAWTTPGGQLLWGAISKAVRAPARYDREVFFPGAPPFLVVGGPNFQSEVARVVEVGYRAQPTNTFSYSVTAYRHDWDRLRSGTAIPVEIENRIEGPVQGVEGWATWRPASRWQIGGGVTYLDKDLRLEPGSTDPVGLDNQTLANDPDYHIMMRSIVELSERVSFHALIRRIDDLPNPAVPDYTAIDASVSWTPRPGVALSLIAQNLFGGSHREYGDAQSGSEIPRSVFLELRFPAY